MFLGKIIHRFMFFPLRIFTFCSIFALSKVKYAISTASAAIATSMPTVGNTATSSSSECSPPNSGRDTRRLTTSIALSVGATMLMFTTSTPSNQDRRIGVRMDLTRSSKASQNLTSKANLVLTSRKENQASTTVRVSAMADESLTTIRLRLSACARK